MKKDNSIAVKVIYCDEPNSFYESDAHMVAIPLKDEEISVMPFHVPIIDLLGEGDIRIYNNKEEVVKKIHVKGGFFKFEDVKLTILLDNT